MIGRDGTRMTGPWSIDVFTPPADRRPCRHPFNGVQPCPRVAGDERSLLGRRYDSREEAGNAYDDPNDDDPGDRDSHEHGELPAEQLPASNAPGQRRPQRAQTVVNTHNRRRQDHDRNEIEREEDCRGGSPDTFRQRERAPSLVGRPVALADSEPSRRLSLDHLALFPSDPPCD